MENDIFYTKIFIDKRLGGILQPNGTLDIQNESDFYLNVFLTRTYKKVGEYVQVDKDPFQSKIPRLNVNPYFIELGFFETILGKSMTGNTFVQISDKENAIIDKANSFNITINKE